MKTAASAQATRVIERVTGAAVLLVAAIFVLSYLAVAVQRIGYPYELEWMEGGSVDHVGRIRSGLPLYVEPTPEFVPFIYTPAYFYAAAGLSHVLGVSLLPLRLLSFLSSLGCLFVVARFVQVETRERWAGLVGAGVFAATYQISGSWFDLARVDSLFLFFLLSGCYLARNYKNRWGAVGAGLLMAISFQTKQTALVVALPVLLVVAMTRGPRGLLPGITFLVSMLGSMWLLDRWHDGWYWYYTMQLPRQHAIAFESLGEFWIKDIAAVLPAFVIGCTYLLRQVVAESATKQQRKMACNHLVFAAAMLLSAWISRLHSGGYVNVLFPLHAAIAIAAACCWGSLGPSSASRSKSLRFVVSAGLLIQFGLLAYAPWQQLPSDEHRAAFSQVVERIKRIEGRVIVPYHGYLAALAGKASYSQHMAVADVKRGNNPVLRDKLNEAIEDALRRQAYAAIVLDVRQFHEEILDKYYVFAGPTVGRANDLLPLTGAPYRPWRLYLPRRE